MPMPSIYGMRNGCALTPEGGIPTFTIRIEPASRPTGSCRNRRH